MATVSICYHPYDIYISVRERGEDFRTEVSCPEYEQEEEEHTTSNHKKDQILPQMRNGLSSLHYANQLQQDVYKHTDETIR